MNEAVNADRSRRATPSREIGADGRFHRQASRFTDRVTADGSSGFPAEAGRCHLIVSLACPWAHRSLLVRRLRGLEGAVSLAVVDPIRDERGWRFSPEVDPSVEPDGREPVTGVRFLAEAYHATDPDYDGRVTVPTLWDRETQRVVSNEFLDLPRQLNTEMAALGDPDVDLYPAELRADIDAVAEALYHDVNNGVYKAGLATTQEAHDEAVAALFARLAWLDERLASQRYLVGDRLTLADVALFPTLVRFDPVYAVHFKCTRRRLVDHPHLWAYARDLCQHPGFAETVDLDHIMRHYYRTHPHLNPSGLVPESPDADWDAHHGREGLP